jgi:hypothetical protein
VTQLRDDFDEENPHWHWWTGGSGTGYIKDGYAYLSMSASKEGASFAALMDPVEKIGYPWLYTGLEIRLRCSEDNGLKHGKGGGYRVWGLGDGYPQPIPNNALLFESFSSQSHPDFVGFWARSIVDNTLTLSTPLEVDMTDWHTYSILWEPGNASFLIDERIVGTTNKSPKKPLCVYTYIENAFIHETPRPSKGLRSYGQYRWSHFHNSDDVSIQYDFIHLFGNNNSRGR